MKKIAIIMTFVAMCAMTSCSSLSNMGNTAAVTSGAACGKALVALNASHKAGTLAITNPTDLSNMLIVINAYNNLKANKQDESYKKSFAAGMVTGGNGIINTVNATSIINGLLNSSALEGTNATNIANNVQTVSTIIQLLGALK